MSTLLQVEKCISAVKSHPNTRGLPTGNLKILLLKYCETKHFQEQVVGKLEGNALADSVCNYVEKQSAKDGNPWKRVPPKKQASSGKENRTPSGPPSKGKGKPKEPQKGPWTALQHREGVWAAQAQNDAEEEAPLIPYGELNRARAGLMRQRSRTCGTWTTS